MSIENQQKFQPGKSGLRKIRSRSLRDLAEVFRDKAEKIDPNKVIIGKGNTRYDQATWEKSWGEYEDSIAEKSDETWLEREEDMAYAQREIELGVEQRENRYKAMQLCGSRNIY